jgi:hypothetical protein
MTQQPEKDYDIDDGFIFLSKASLPPCAFSTLGPREK